MDKNNLINDNNMDIVIGEDVLGGLFGIKDNMLYYFAPDTLSWESLDISYVQFMSWLISTPDNVNKFYEINRWDTWKEDASKLDITEGFSIYPLLFTENKLSVNDRSRKNIPINDIIAMNKEFVKKLK